MTIPACFEPPDIHEDYITDESKALAANNTLSALLDPQFDQHAINVRAAYGFGMAFSSVCSLVCVIQASILYSELTVQMVSLDDKLFYIDTMRTRLPEATQFFASISVCAAASCGCIVAYGPVVGWIMMSIVAGGALLWLILYALVDAPKMHSQMQNTTEAMMRYKAAPPAHGTVMKWVWEVLTCAWLRSERPQIRVIEVGR